MKNLLVSVSGGKTSMMMMKLLHDKYSETHNILNVFANTGAEHPETLDFVKRCSDNWGIDIVWVEAIVHTGRKSCTHKIVDHSTASRKQEPFEEVIKKYGLPNQNYPHCNREMKLNPIHSLAMDYFDSRHRFSNYETAIGIRMDEMDRMMVKAVENNFIYPMIQDFRLFKEDVLHFWDSLDWRLNIPEHYGNCLTCFKKSTRKLVTIAREAPEWFLPFAEFEDRYSHVKAPDTPRIFFRGKNTVRDIFEMKYSDIESFVDGNFIEYDSEIDLDIPCSHECALT